jgi:hypothetical protein
MGGDNQQTDDQFFHLLILYRVSLIALFSPTVIGAPALLLTFSGLAKVAIFTTNVDTENQSLIIHKYISGVLNRHFCQTRVIAIFHFKKLSQV